MPRPRPITRTQRPKLHDDVKRYLLGDLRFDDEELQFKNNVWDPEIADRCLQLLEITYRVHLQMNDGKHESHIWAMWREELIEEYLRDPDHLCTRPWPYWEFDVADSDLTESQAAYLARKNELTPKERRYLAKYPEILKVQDEE